MRVLGFEIHKCNLLWNHVNPDIMVSNSMVALDYVVREKTVCFMTGWGGGGGRDNRMVNNVY